MNIVHGSKNLSTLKIIVSLSIMLRSKIESLTIAGTFVFKGVSNNVFSRSHEQFIIVHIHHAP